MQLQLHSKITLHHNYNSITLQLQLQLHYIHHTTSSSCGWGDRPGDHCNHCNHSKKHNSNHLSVHQWIRSAIRDSQQPTSPIVSYFWNFRHRLVRYYWYIYLCLCVLYKYSRYPCLCVRENIHRHWFPQTCTATVSRNRLPKVLDVLWYVSNELVIQVKQIKPQRTQSTPWQWSAT